MSDLWHTKAAKARTGELSDIAAMDRLARDLAPASSLRRYARGLGYGAVSATRTRWNHRRRHVSHAR